MIRSRFNFESTNNRKQFLLSVALSPIMYIVEKSYHIKSISENVDFVNLMTYDYHTPNTFPYTNHNSPLYPSNYDLLYFKYFNIHFSVHYMNKLGIAKKQIMVGIPFYGYLYFLSNENYHSIYSLYNGTESKRH